MVAIRLAPALSAAFASVVLVAGGAVPAAPASYARQASDLTGTWHDAAGNPYVLTQTGSKLTWYAHALDNKTWAHDFTGTISTDKYSGTYQDRAGYDRHFHGRIDGRIRDNCHITVHLTVAENGDEITGALSRKCIPAAPPFAVAFTLRGNEKRPVLLKFAAITGSGRILSAQPNSNGEGKVIQIDKGDIHLRLQFKGQRAPADVLLRIRVGGEYWVRKKQLNRLPVEVIESDIKRCVVGSRGRLTAFPPDFIVLYHVCGREIGWDRGTDAYVSVRVR